MNLFIIGYAVLFIALVAVTKCNTEKESEEFLYGQFPKDFVWGLSSAAYQIEGGWNQDGKGESIWDVFVHKNPSPILDGSTGDIACNSYNMFAEDVKLLKAIGANAYRFSLSWPRILPNGTLELINQAGIDYYNKLIDLLIQNDIEPVITLYHWDLPQNLQELLGGWPNEEMIQHFANYAELAFTKFGDRVNKWLTFNEAWVLCQMGWGEGIFAPGISEKAELPYKCAHTIIKSHATAYRIYESKFKPKFGGQVGIVVDSGWFEPEDPNNEADVQASERALQFKHGLMASPLIYGKYPDVVRMYIDEKSKKEGREISRLPVFDSHWTKIINGTLDFLGLNHYTTVMVTSKHRSGSPGWDGDQDLSTYQKESWPKSASSWLRVVPWGFRSILKWIKKTYNDIPIFVTENGYSEPENSFLNDEKRVDYYKQYTNQMLKAIVYDKCNVKGYFGWSLIDNFEWSSGYSERFGVHWVNFSDPSRERLPKNSAKFLKNLFVKNGFQEQVNDHEEL